MDLQTKKRKDLLMFYIYKWYIYNIYIYLEDKHAILQGGKNENRT